MIKTIVQIHGESICLLCYTYRVRVKRNRRETNAMIWYICTRFIAIQMPLDYFAMTSPRNTKMITHFVVMNVTAQRQQKQIQFLLNWFENFISISSLINFFHVPFDRNHQLILKKKKIWKVNNRKRKCFCGWLLFGIDRDSRNFQISFLKRQKQKSIISFLLCFCEDFNSMIFHFRSE